MAERSFFTEVAEELKSEVDEFRRDSKASDAPPFGMERVRRKTFMQRYQGMSPEMRAAWLKRVGPKRAMAMLRSK